MPNDVDFQRATMTSTTVGGLNRFVAGDAFEHTSACIVRSDCCCNDVVHYVIDAPQPIRNRRWQHGRGI